MARVSRRILWISTGIIAIVLILFSLFSELIADWLWMSQLGYSDVFRRMLLLKAALSLSGGVLAFIYSWFHIRLLARNLFIHRRPADSKVIELHTGDRFELPVALLRWGPVFLSVLAAIPFLFFFWESWDLLLRFLWSASFDRIDPVYEKDIGFYLFRFPFYDLIQDTFTSLAFVILAFLLAAYFYIFTVRRETERLFSTPVARHLAIALLFFLTGWACGYFLDRYELLFSTSGLVNGAGYTDLYVVRISLWAAFLLTPILGVFIIWGLIRKRPLIAAAGGGGYILLILIALQAAPIMVQNFVVEPNELELERPYLEYDIEFTSAAYGLDRIQEKSYPALTDLSIEKIRDNRQTLNNVRLWDWRPLRQTYRQLQEIRLYYHFYEVDVDRYHLNGEYRQVMLSARELAPELPERADTWVNQILQFTHGYGLAMNLASQEGREGTPTFLVKDIPPVTAEGIEIDQAAIYYGEKMPGYRIVNTRIKELDYPREDENVYTSYAGEGGVPLASLWKKLLFAWEFGDINILLTDYITPESRIQFRRQVQERISGIAPFLRLDPDPYLVVSEEGRLFWIQDAYTTSSRFPYSEPYQGRFNYIRNSVKVVMDAFHGTVYFYVMDSEDPVLQVYREAFPGLFRPLDEISADLKRHLRFPQGLFTIQAEKYNRYHMTIPQVFYNNEDLWTFPQEKYAGTPTQMEPYYILMELPEEDNLEYLLMIPLTPEKRNNMIAWLAVRCDFPEYGRMFVYKLPKEKLILGPMQVEAMIDQDTLISRQLSLWDQRGSQVIRGNLLVIPIGESFIYVEPVYLRAEQMDIPQLRRVIVAYNDHVAMEPTLEEAVLAVFGAAPEREEKAPGAVAPQVPEARETFRKAQEALQAGDWREFGRAMQELQSLLGEPPVPPVEEEGGP